jgi:uncharacterized RDD family membrane protein YckC
MSEIEAFNPYAPPQATVLTAPTNDTELPLGSRWRRLVASFIDSLIMMVIVMPLQFMTGTFQREMERQQGGGSMFAFQPENLVWSAVGLAVLIGINWNFLARGQTIGKKAMSLRIDRIEGGACDRSRIIVRRMTILQVIYLIPIINFIFMIIDSLMIFRGNKRTLHDEIAGTKVVDVRAAQA